MHRSAVSAPAPARHAESRCQRSRGARTASPPAAPALTPAAAAALQRSAGNQHVCELLQRSRRTRGAMLMRREVVVPGRPRIRTEEHSPEELEELIHELRMSNDPDDAAAAQQIDLALRAGEFNRARAAPAASAGRPAKRHARGSETASAPAAPERGTLAVLPDRLILDILRWAGGVDDCFAGPFAFDVRTLGRIATLNRWWRNFVNTAALGFYRQDVRAAEARAPVKARQIDRAMPATVMSGREMKGLTDLANNLLQHFPPAQFAYISLGNSPAPLLAYIAFHRRDASVLFLPLSEIDAESLVKWDDDAVMRGRMTQYLLRYIPPARLRGRPSAVVIDIVGSGMSLRAAHALLQRFYGSIGHNVNLLMLMLNAREALARPPLLAEMPGGNRQVLPAQTIRGLVGTSNQDYFQNAILGREIKEGLLFLMWRRISISEVFAGTRTQGELASDEFRRMVLELRQLPDLLRQLAELE